RFRPSRSSSRSSASNVQASRDIEIVQRRLLSQESQHAGSAWFLVPTLSSGVGKRLDQGLPRDCSELADGVEPDLQEPGRLSLHPGRRNGFALLQAKSN